LQTSDEPSASVPKRVEHLTPLAQHLVDRCPEELATVATMGGSVAAGHADDFSDVEIHLWSAQPTTFEQRKAFLDTLSASAVWWHDQPGKDGSEWVRFEAFDEIFELGWQTTESLDLVVNALAAGEPWGYGRVGIGWVLTRGAALRDKERLGEACARLLPYPSALAHIVAGATVANQWRDPQHRRTLAAVANRAQWFRLTDELLADALAVLRVLFAVNGAYEPPNWKWIEQEAAVLTNGPDDPVQRIRVALRATQDRPVEAVETMEALVRETIVFAADVTGFALAQTGYA
jgi:hypothetical protein